ncbi:hypothetical protein DFP72DRAFT_884196 [Ephemerocybe angulata]|uniref:C2H2-type domain-containing protein n=1 Tax=Ephemerocybe angulata TaxID=980116 RepID=A0A8H6M8I2_9AGAR|nr:hypothetical protein DFP72DRAFT_884196 [Tulosesus angulatus]
MNPLIIMIHSKLGRSSRPGSFSFDTAFGSGPSIEYPSYFLPREEFLECNAGLTPADLFDVNGRRRPSLDWAHPRFADPSSPLFPLFPSMKPLDMLNPLSPTNLTGLTVPKSPGFGSSYSDVFGPSASPTHGLFPVFNATGGQDKPTIGWPSYHTIEQHPSEVPPMPLCSPATTPVKKTPVKKEPTTVRPHQLSTDVDKDHADAQDALRARFKKSTKKDASNASRSRQSRHPRMEENTLKRLLPMPELDERDDDHLPGQASIQAFPSGLPRTPKPIAPLPRNRMKVESSPAKLVFFNPECTPSSSYPSPSSPPSYRDKGRDGDDDEYIPSSGPQRKRQKRGPSPSSSSHKTHLCRSRNGRKTQLEVVLESLPYEMEDIVRRSGQFKCPFPECGQWTTSEGDLGRHLESSIHATHRYVCLAANCLEQFAREDSMKRHHKNNRGKHHKIEHTRAVLRGLSHRVLKEDVPALKESVLDLARGDGLF